MAGGRSELQNSLSSQKKVLWRRIVKKVIEVRKKFKYELLKEVALKIE